MNQAHEYKEPRNRQIDFLKGIAIFLMVAGHGMSEIEYLKTPFNIIYSFHMPLLMFLSGYLLEMQRCKYEQEGKWKFLKKKAISLLLPYIAWSLLIPFVLSGFSMEILEPKVKVFLGIEGGGLWFLPVLFGLNMIYLLIWKLEEIFSKSKNTNIIVMDIIFLFVLELLIFVLDKVTNNTYISNMLSFAIPFFFGVAIQKSKVIKKIVENKYTVAVCVVAYFVGIQYFDFYNTASITQVIRIILSVFVIIILFHLTKTLLYENMGAKVMITFGKYSLPIYLIHIYFMEWKGILETIFPSAVIGTVAVIIGSVITCMISIGVAKVIAVSPILNKMILGK